MRRVFASAALFVWVLAFAVIASPTEAAAQQGDGDHKVLVVATPHLTWERAERFGPSSLFDLFSRGSLASTSVRTVGPTTDAGEAYLTLGAGNRASTDPATDGLVVERTETLTTGDPATLYQRSTGIEPTAPILALGWPQILARNSTQSFGTEPGALALALDDADRVVSVIGNADRLLDEPTWRHAGLFGADDTGQVHGGAVGAGLLEADPLSASGLRLSTDAVEATFAEAWSASDVVLFEMSDLSRAEAARPVSTPDQADRLYGQALDHDDEILGRLLAQLGPGDQVFVIGPTAPADDEQLTVFAAVGPEFTEDLASSSTTRRAGYVALADLAPTILDGFRIEVPSSMGDTRITSEGGQGTAVSARIDQMIDDSARAVVRDNAFGVLTVIFIVMLVIDLAAAVLCLARVPQLAQAVRLVSIALLWVPPLAFLTGLLPLASFNTATLGVVLFGAAGIAALLTQWSAGGRDSSRLPAPTYPVLATWAVLAADIATGGHLQINTIFGYSPIVAGRFAGFGNQAFSMFSISALLIVTTVVGVLSPAGRPGRGLLWSVVGFYVVSVVLVGHPAFGSDVGGILALVPAAAVSMLLLWRVAIRIRTALLIAVGTVAVLGVFAAIDLARPPESRTHLGRFVAKVLDGEALEILQRKLEANLSVLDSVWSWVIPLALAFFIYLMWRPNRTLRLLQAEYSGLRAFAISGLLLGVIALLVNDSGVSMPAMMLAIALPFVAYLAIEVEAGEDVGDRAP